MRRPLSLVVLAAVLAGCAAAARPRPAVTAVAGARVAVLPFRTGGTLDALAAFARTSEAAEPEEVGVTVARALAERLAERFRVVDPDLVFGTAGRVEAGAYDAAFAARVASKVGAELAVLGAVTRFRQREGSAWAAQTPASVAYDAALVRVADGAVLGRERFDYTQQSLSENLLDLPWFIEGGGRWMTREEILGGASRRTAERLAAGATAPPR